METPRFNLQSIDELIPDEDISRLSSPHPDGASKHDIHVSQTGKLRIFRRSGTPFPDTSRHRGAFA
jgi:hypothetical protein